ncbi:hypothetical protein AHAS_Ahas11G0305800 [Arachis hypogaea]
MLTRISHRKLWTSARRVLRPSLCRTSSARLPSPLSHSHTFSSSAFALRSTTYAYFDFNFLHWKRHCFSTQPALELPAGKIVDVPLAQTGEGIAECELLKWHVQEGDYIEDFQPLCEVQSDKATIEITSRYKGKVAHVLHVPGDIVKVGETLLKILVDETAFPSATVGDSEITKSLHSDQVLVNESASAIAALGNSNNAELLDSDLEKRKRAAVLSTPAVRSLAKQHGIDINEVCGTGKDGRVLKEDVLNFAAKKGIIVSVSAVLDADNVEKPRGAEGYTVTPEYKSPSEDRILPLRCQAHFSANTSQITVNGPHQVPSLNSCFKEDSMEIIFKGSHNIGVAMATPNGLVVPNIKNVQSLSILEITKELARLQQLASENKLTSEDISGGTITLSNIGAIGGKFGSPLLNLPEVSIIAIGRIQKIPQFDGNGNVYPVSLMTVNVGADHRVLDGATVSRFCNEWKQLIENPELLMLHLK